MAARMLGAWIPSQDFRKVVTHTDTHIWTLCTELLATISLALSTRERREIKSIFATTAEKRWLLLVFPLHQKYKISTVTLALM